MKNTSIMDGRGGGMGKKAPPLHVPILYVFILYIL